MNGRSAPARPELGYRSRASARSVAGYSAVGAATVMAPLIIVAPLGAAGFKAIVLKAPYSGSAFAGQNGVTSNGCGGLAALTKVGKMTLSTGKMTGEVTSSSGVCGAYGFPTYSSSQAYEEAGIDGAPFSVATTSYHTISASWKASGTISVSMFFQNRSQYNAAYTSIEISGYLWNVTGNRYFYGGTSFNNHTSLLYQNHTSVYRESGLVYTIFANTTLFAGITYEWVTWVYLDVATVVLNIGASTASATLDLASSGSGATLTQVAVK